MSCTALLPPPASHRAPRKRTRSFSGPKPPRPSRSSALRRTDSFLTLADAFAAASSSSARASPHDCSALVPHTRTLRHYKEQRQARHLHRGAFTTDPESFLPGEPTSHSHPVISLEPPAPAPTPLRRSTSPFRHRTSSPLAPAPTLLPPRPAFPRSKRDADADLYRRALLTRMRCSPEGQKILLMGARLAVSMLTATRDLERLVADECDVVMSDAWVAVQSEGDEWEMIDS